MGYRRARLVGRTSFEGVTRPQLTRDSAELISTLLFVLFFLHRIYNSHGHTREERVTRARVRGGRGDEWLKRISTSYPRWLGSPHNGNVTLARDARIRCGNN